MTLRDSGGEVGVSGKYGEGYSEYYDRLLENVADNADFQGPPQLRILAQSAFDEGSRLARKLSDQGILILPILFDIIGTGTREQRATILLVLADVAVKTKSLPHSDYSRIMNALVSGMHDETAPGSISVRMSAARAVGRIGGVESIHALEEVA